MIIRQRCFLTLLVVILCLLAFKQAASAQTAQLTGIVTDTNSAVISGAELTLTNVATGVARKAVTNTSGSYSIPFVPPGHYRLHVFATGFKSMSRDGVTLNVEPLRLDFTLEIGALTETVNISENDPLLERETSSIGQVFENKTIVTLPLNGRNYSQLVADARRYAESINTGSRWIRAFLADYYCGFFNDSWKVSPKLTVNLGLRYEVQTRYREKDNRQTFFDSTPGSLTYGTLVQVRDGGHRQQTFSNLDKNNFAPRVALAWQLNQKTVVRNGFGIFYSGVGYHSPTNSTQRNPPHFVNININSPTFVEDDDFYFHLLGGEIFAATGLIADITPPYRLYAANLNHVQSSGNPFAVSDYRARYFGFCRTP